MPDSPHISAAAVEAGALAMFADTIRVVAPALDDDAIAHRWTKTPDITQDHYRTRARNVLTAAHPEIAGPAWAEGHDDGQTNLINEPIIATGVRTRLTNPYPYTLEPA